MNAGIVFLELAGEDEDEVTGEEGVLVEVDVDVEVSSIGNQANISTRKAVVRIGVRASTLFDGWLLLQQQGPSPPGRRQEFSARVGSASGQRVAVDEGYAVRFSWICDLYYIISSERDFYSSMFSSEKDDIIM